jgi:ketosteroid isomerase-like protein
MRRIAVALALTAALVLRGTPGAAQPPDPAAVIDAYTAALNAGNAEAALAFIADDAVYMRPAGRFVGKDEVRGFIEGLIRRGVQIEVLGEREVFGEYVRWASHVRFANPGGGPAEVRNRAASIVQEGKIIFHSARPLE